MSTIHTKHFNLKLWNLNPLRVINEIAPIEVEGKRRVKDELVLAEVQGDRVQGNSAGEKGNPY